MKLTLNGEIFQYQGSPRLEALIASIVPKARGVAVTINDQVIFRSDYAATELRENDVVEIFQIVGGG